MSKPTHKIRNGRISAAIFENENGTSIVLQKSFKKGKDWKNMNLTVFPNELDAIKEVLEGVGSHLEAEESASKPSIEAEKVEADNFIENSQFAGVAQ